MDFEDSVGRRCFYLRPSTRSDEYWSKMFQKILIIRIINDRCNFMYSSQCVGISIWDKASTLRNMWAVHQGKNDWRLSFLVDSYVNLIPLRTTSLLIEPEKKNSLVRVNHGVILILGEPRNLSKFACNWNAAWTKLNYVQYLVVFHYVPWKLKAVWDRP